MLIFDTIRLCLIEVAGARHRDGHRLKIALPSAFPYRTDLADLADSISVLPP